MSWWVYLLGDDDKLVVVERHVEGGTYVIGGTDRAEINVTYNYSGHLAEALGKDSFSELSGMLAKDALPLLEAGAAKLGDDPDADYWAVTPGNAGHVLAILACWAKQYPEARFKVS